MPESRPPILTLTTDFGPDGPYVAALKGVILGRVPHTRLIDVSHQVAPQNVLEGAFVISSILDTFPPGTVHLAVVDPGVGTDRPIVAVLVADQWLVAPDNGLPQGAIGRRKVEEIWRVSNPALQRGTVSHTFHGRDIMAPAACHLLNGGDPAELGPRQDTLVELAGLTAEATKDGLLGEVIFRDRFGNLVTNLHEDLLDNHLDWRVHIGGRVITGLCRAYGERPPGELVALVGSSHWLEIAVVNGDAARRIGIGPGATVSAWAVASEASQHA